MCAFKSNMRSRARDAANARKNQTFGNSCLRFPEGRKIEFFGIDKDSTVRIDIIPYVVSDKHHPDRQHGAEVGSLWHSRRYFIHRDVGSDNRAIICPNKTWGKPCPICDYGKQRRKEGASKKELDSYWPKEKMLYNVIDTEGDKNKVLLYDVSYHNFTKQLDRELVEGEEDWGGFAELENGYTLKARFAMESFNKTSFAKCDRIDFVVRKYDYDERDVEDGLCLDDLLIEVPYGEMEELFMGGDVSGSTSSTDDDRRSSRDDRRGRTSQEEEPEERVSAQSKRDTADDEEEKEERITRGKRSTRTEETVARESEDSDEDNDKPKRGRGRPRKDNTEEEERPLRTREKRTREEEPEEKEERPARGRSRARDEEEEQEEKPTRTRRGRDDDERDAKKTKAGTEGGTCPHDHKFGKDLDKYSDCDDCEKWGACRDENSR